MEIFSRRRTGQRARQVKLLTHWEGTLRAFKATIVLLIAAPASAQQPEPARIDEIFASLSGSQHPGCAVGVAKDGTTVLSKAYGSADLEHDALNSPVTIFEAGSVSKQFTAAAVLMLAEDGKLQLSDDVREYVPELPDYGAKITIDHLLNHTSGLRDWGAVMAITGWPRGTRAYKMEDVLAIIARQRALNHLPGAEYSYTNSGYNLLAIIVQRVSGASLADFTRSRMFQPLGMISTSWRDEFRRVVPGRAIAYGWNGDRFEQAMPFEDNYGAGGLLTTVHDLLAWNQALDTGQLGPQVTQQLAERSTLKDGKRITYARGLFVQQFRGQQEISHGGATGGYRAWLGRYPEQRVSVALLCNTGAANPTSLGQKVAEAFLPAVRAEQVSGSEVPSIEANGALAGMFVNERDGMSLELRVEEGRLRAAGRPPFEAVASDRFRSGSAELRFAGSGQFAVHLPGEEALNYRRATRFAPTLAQLVRFTGRYASAEAGAAYHVVMEDDGLVMRLEDRPHIEIKLRPAYADAFQTADGIVRFRRNARGAVTGFGAGIARVRDMHFRRTGPVPAL